MASGMGASVAHFAAGRGGDEDAEEELMQRAKRRLKRLSSQEPSPSRIHRMRRAAGGMGTVSDLAMVVVRSRPFEIFILLVIVVNAVYIGVETDYQGDKLQPVCEVLGPIIFSIYLGEMLLKFTAYQDMFFRVPMEGKWNLFETGLVMISLVDLILGGMSRQAGGGWTGLLTLRLLRLIKVIRWMKVMDTGHNLGKLMFAIVKSVRAIAWLLLTFLLLFWAYAVLGTRSFGKMEAFQDDYFVQRHFGSTALTFATLFAVGTLDDWSSIARHIANNLDSDFQELLVWLYFVSFIMLVALNALSLWNAVFVEAAITLMKDVQTLRRRQQMRQIQDMERKLYCAFTQMDEDGNGLISAQELKKIACSKVVKTMLSDIGMHYRDIFDAVETIDDDNDGHVDYEEFVAFVFHQEEAASKLDCRKLKYQISELHDELLDLKINMGMPLMGDNPSAPSSPKTPKVGLSPLSHRKAASTRALSGNAAGLKVASVLPMPDFKFKKDEDGKPLRMAKKIKDLASMNRAVKLMSVAAGPSRTASDAEAAVEKLDGAQVPREPDSTGDAVAGGVSSAVAGGETSDRSPKDLSGGAGAPKGRRPHKIVPSRLKEIKK